MLFDSNIIIYTYYSNSFLLIGLLNLLNFSRILFLINVIANFIILGDYYKYVIYTCPLYGGINDICGGGGGGGWYIIRIICFRGI